MLGANFSSCLPREPPKSGRQFSGSIISHAYGLGNKYFPADSSFVSTTLRRSCPDSGGCMRFAGQCSLLPTAVVRGCLVELLLVVGVAHRSSGVCSVGLLRYLITAQREVAPPSLRWNDSWHKNSSCPVVFSEESKRAPISKLGRWMLGPFKGSPRAQMVR